MGSNQFGKHFKITTWGESHGKAIGVVIDGCPAGLPITSEEINEALSQRRPGQTPFTSPRKEEDRAEIYSGVFEGKTTGSPISIIIFNHDADSSAYEPIKDVLRPGHASYTYKEKYGIYDYRGGGRASARETACRVAAGAIAKKLLMLHGIELAAFLCQVGNQTAYEPPYEEVDSLHEATLESPIFCPDPKAEKEMIQLIQTCKDQGDSIGGIVEMRVEGVPAGLGDPVYEKLEANFGKGLLSIPACKGVEFGDGFASCSMKGSEHNDLFGKNAENQIITTTNHAGGLLGGISNGMPITVRAAFKPTSSIRLPQNTLNEAKESTTLTLSPKAKHDPCVAIRAVPVVAAMGALVLIDSLLMNRLVKAL